MNPLAFTASVVRISIPYGAGALGGTLSERSGVVNIALEGLMLGSAFAYVAGAWWVADWLGPGGAPTASWLAPLAGLAAGVAAGFVLALIHAWATVWLRADHIISGLAINIFALGATNFLLKRIFGSSSNSPRVPGFTNWEVFARGGPLEPLNLLLHPLIVATILLFAAVHVLMHRTRFGLRLRAVGENPRAADSLGVSVNFYRAWGVLLGGMSASLGGVWLASEQGLFSSGMTNGRGYIALAAMIVGKWRPAGAAAACLIFGFAEAAQNQLQVMKQGLRGLDPSQMTWFSRIAAEVPTQAIQAFPFLLTIILIAGFIGRSTPPAAAGTAFEKENG